MDLVSADAIEAIHQASLAILRDTGIQFMSPRVCTFLTAKSGVSVDQEAQIVRFDPDLVEATIQCTPKAYTIHARNPAHSVKVGGTHLSFSNVITPPYVADLDGGKRNGSEAEYRELLKLCQALNALNFVFGYPVEPQDLDPETRHLDAYRGYIELTDKVWRGYTLGDDRILDAIEMARIARGISHETLLSEPSFIANVTTNSPLRVDEPMGDGLMMMAEKNQPVSITSFAMAGAIAPITLAGAIAQSQTQVRVWRLGLCRLRQEQSTGHA